MPSAAIAASGAPAAAMLASVMLASAIAVALTAQLLKLANGI
jgi:hypothetical protein